MKLYNTLSRQIEEIQPIHPGKIGFYACGFTVYDYAHLGHLRRYVMDDVLLRTLHHAGFEVKLVENVTDVGHLTSDADTGEDKLEKGAKKYQTSVWDIAKKFEEHFYTSLDKLNVQRPDVTCRATEHIDEQLAMVEELEKKGFAYVIENDGVYFDTSKLDDYGKLAKLDVEKLQEGARIGKVEGKKNPTDFALWKFEHEGENRAMVWPSPWAERSFPGWHIECSAMSMKYLGDQFDIHTGGIDHIPVHHTNEIAQAEAVTGKKPFVKYWVHHNHLLIDGEKMSKSLDNFFTVDDVVERGINPMALRLLFLSAHYRSEMNFTWENLAGVEKSYQKLVELMSGLEDEGEIGEAGQKYLDRFFELMENDLKTPEALAVMWEVTKSELDGAEKKAVLLEMDEAFGLGLEQARQDDLPSEITQLVTEREQARHAGDWKKADELRQEIEKRGYKVRDEATYSVVTQSNPAS